MQNTETEEGGLLHQQKQISDKCLIITLCNIQQFVNELVNELYILQFFFYNIFCISMSLVCDGIKLIQNSEKDTISSRK